MIKTASLRDRTRATRAQARIRRNGGGSLVTHCMAQGLRKKQAKSVAGSLGRINKDKLGMAGTPHTYHVGGEVREGQRWTGDQVQLMALIYRPRLELYKLAAVGLRQGVN